MRINRVTKDIRATRIEFTTTPEEYRRAVVALGGFQETMPILGEKVMEHLTGLEVEGADWVRTMRNQDGTVTIKIGSQHE